MDTPRLLAMSIGGGILRAAEAARELRCECGGTALNLYSIRHAGSVAVVREKVRERINRSRSPAVGKRSGDLKGSSATMARCVLATEF